eukprot:2632811-Pleurochrysis_carterae.AAC.2
MARSTDRRKPLRWKYSLPGSVVAAHELGDPVAQPLVLRVQFLDLCRHWFHVEELTSRAHVVVRVLGLELLAAE